MDMPTYMELEKQKERIRILEEVTEKMYLTLMPKEKEEKEKK